MDLNKFIADINKKGLAKASRFEVLLSKPSGDATSEYDMRMRIESVDFPGRSLTMAESNFTGMPYKIVSGATFAEIPISVILSENFREKEYLEGWQNLAVGDYTKRQIQGNSFNLGYYKNYIGTVEITQYNEIDKPVYRCKLIDAYPSGIGTMNATWANGEEILRLPVTFTYRYYTTEEVK